VVELIALAGPDPFRGWFDQPSMNRGDGYRALKEQLARPLVAAAERYIPGLAAATVVEEISTPATNRHYVQHQTGAIYGLARTPGQLGRFGPTTPLSGLYLCGSSVYCGGIVPCAQSGWVAGQLAEGYLQRLRPQVSAARRLWRQSAQWAQLWML